MGPDHSLVGQGSLGGQKHQRQLWTQHRQFVVALAVVLCQVVVDHNNNAAHAVVVASGEYWVLISVLSLPV